MNIKNILLIGRTGSGKSTLANTLINQNNNFEEVFKESSGSVSETKHIQHQEFIVEISSTEKIRYLVVDTAGFGDTQLTNKEVLQLLQGLAPVLGNEGLNQIFFVTDGRFTQAEVETYQILESTLFDKDVARHTTIVRTKFEDFEKSEVCEADRKKLREENNELLGILKNSKIIYVDNPKMKGRYLEMAKDTREVSRKRVITYLGTCQETYKPSNLNELNQRINNYKTKTEQLENEIKAKQQAIKDQEAKLQRDIQTAKTQQQNELENNRRSFDQQIQNSRSSYNQQLQNTRNQLQNNYQSQVQQSQQRFDREQAETESRRQREIDSIRAETTRISRDLEIRAKKREPWNVGYSAGIRNWRNSLIDGDEYKRKFGWEAWDRKLDSTVKGWKRRQKDMIMMKKKPDMKGRVLAFVIKITEIKVLQLL